MPTRMPWRRPELFWNRYKKNLAVSPSVPSRAQKPIVTHKKRRGEGLNNFKDFNLILISWFIKLSIQTFQRLIIIYRRGKFVYHHWRCASIYWPLSYPFRYLVFSIKIFLITTYKILSLFWQCLSKRVYIWF